MPEKSAIQLCSNCGKEQGERKLLDGRDTMILGKSCTGFLQTLGTRVEPIVEVGEDND